MYIYTNGVFGANFPPSKKMLKKFYLFAICLMALLFAGCEGNYPTSSNSLIVTGEAIDVTFNSATIYGEINGEITDYESIEWGVMYSSDKAEVESRNGEKVFGSDDLLENVYSVFLSKLVAETKYYYCAFVYLNGKQYKFGKVKSFTTLETKSYFTPKAFSVSANKQVTFSPGNLQFTRSTNTWYFAKNQWDIIGLDNVTDGSVSSDPTYGDSKEGTALADKVDLFGWSTSNSTTPFGVSTSTDDNDYYGNFVDWGINKIGNDAPNTWRTLTSDEWDYIVFARPNASSLCGVAQVNGVNGLILLPDSWKSPDGVTFKSGFHSNHGVDYYADYQTFTANQWSKLEATGAVFLPASGGREGEDVNAVQYFGRYWAIYGRYLYFRSDVADMRMYDLYAGRAVRLIKDL